MIHVCQKPFDFAQDKYHSWSKSCKGKTLAYTRITARDDSFRKILWQELRANKLGVHFRRQQIIKGYIVNFYCHKAGLVIEVDGDIHEEETQKESDDMRAKVLSELGLRLVRFRNKEVLMDLPKILGKIQELVT